MEIDEKDISYNLAYGVYCYADYDENGEWDRNCAHCIPEVLLPYNLIASKVEYGVYKLTSYEYKEFFKFHMPYRKERPKYIVNLGEAVYGFIDSKHDIDYYRKGVEEFGNEYGDEDELNEAKEQMEQYKKLLPKAYKNFLRYHRNYEPKYPKIMCKTDEKEKD